MNLFKILSCENYEKINQQILQFIDNRNLRNSDNFWNPVNVKDLLNQCILFKEWLVKTNLLITASSVTVGKHFFCCGPHIDTAPARYKLSWPVLNTKNTFNRWYTTKNSQQYTLNNLGGKIYEAENLKEIEKVEVLYPMLIDAGTIHDVYIQDNVFPRLGLQCQLLQEPDKL